MARNHYNRLNNLRNNPLDRENNNRLYCKNKGINVTTTLFNDIQQNIE